MFDVSIIWKDGCVTHDSYNDPYRIAKKYTRKEIESIYKNNDKIEHINIAYVSI